MSTIEKILTNKATLYVAGGVVILLILENFGLINIFKTKDERTEEKEESEIKKVAKQVSKDQNLWSTTFWKLSPTKQYTSSQADNLADHIWNAFGLFNDDEAKIFGVFRTIKFQTNVSQIADSFSKRYARDLLSELQDRLSEKEMNQVYEIISQKPL